MVDIKEVIESQEMRDVVKALDALKRRWAPNHQVTDHVRPTVLALVGRYKAKEILQVLLDNNEYYPGYKEVLAASFGGWLIMPKERRVRETLMVHAALDHMDDSERKLGEAELSLKRDITARYVLTSMDFLIEIYDCMGGYQAFAQNPTLEMLWIAFERDEKVINTAVLAITFLHHAVDRFTTRGRPFVPSLNKAVLVLDELKATKPPFPYKEKYVSRSLLHQHWSQNKEILALLYAASTIRINRKTLLQLILDGLFSYNKHQPYLSLWVCRARYVSSHIFSRMGDPDLNRKTMRVIGEGTLATFAPPKLGEIEAASFSRTFRNIING
ncbi:hypothetical protein [Rhizobium rhizogenes]|uniref:Uncharacterized protein n=1 Tax=Rhizobium rhizogenes TaxID=359 RepID=A0AA92C2X4_RHIRH|nr:hypothetical protein [Rhizobium rhizogenes]PVE54020.1 hypothetical protein DC430_12285 [Rhizobium rhizogenes]PVE66512.1 hypothetical protein DC415_08900 [Agrobacterium tumefaciens]PVE76500.1 hypothetical protein DCP16_08900 [Sphingomonas sp. TPD3009]